MDIKIVGTTKVTGDGKITLIKDVRTILKANKGDVIIYCRDKNGDIIIRNAMARISTSKEFTLVTDK